METPVTKNKVDSTDHPLSISYTSARLAKPPTMLAAIWAKAQEHLLTPGSISVLPSDDDTGTQSTRRAKRFAVYSRSNPDCPNVVKLYDDGSIECPCPMFKSSRNVCSHSVAVAKREDVLAITLDWVRNSESDRNLYNLATKNINVRASGQKGSKERCTRKTQKKATPSYTITNKEQLAFARLSSWEPISLPQVMQPLAPISFSSQTRTSPNPTLTVQPEAASIRLGLGQAMEQRATSTTMRSQYLSTTYLSVTVSNEEQQESVASGGWQPTGLAQAMAQPIPTPLPSQNAIVPSSCHNMYLPTYPTMPQPAVQPHPPSVFLQSINRYVPWHNDSPFIIMNINGRIKKCVGCRREFSDPFGPVFVGLVVQHIERDYYNDKNAFRRIGNEQARYYHPEKACLMARHQHFGPSMLQLHPDLALDAFQARYLRQQLSIEVSPTV